QRGCRESTMRMWARVSSARRWARLLPMKPSPPVIRTVRLEYASASMLRTSSASTAPSMGGCFRRVRERFDRRARQFAPDDELPPCREELQEDAAHVLEAEELAVAETARVVVHRYFHHAAAVGLELLHHLDADDARIAGELDAIEHLAP